MSDQKPVEEVIKEQLKQAYLDGVRDGVTRFAWWKGGMLYVGSCGTTLNEALEDIDKEVR